MAAVPVVLAVLLNALVNRAGSDLHLHADGTWGLYISGDLHSGEPLTPEEAAVAFAAVPLGDSVVTGAGHRFRVLCCRHTMTLRLLPAHLPNVNAEAHPSAGSPDACADLFSFSADPTGTGTRVTPWQFAMLLDDLADVVATATDEAVSTGDTALVAELDQSAAKLRHLATIIRPAQQHLHQLNEKQTGAPGSPSQTPAPTPSQTPTETGIRLEDPGDPAA